MKRQPLEAFRSAVLLAAMLLAGCGAWAPRAQERPQAVETVPATPPAPPPPAPVQPQPDEETPAAIEPPPLKDILAYAHRAARFTPARGRLRQWPRRRARAGRCWSTSPPTGA